MELLFLVLLISEFGIYDCLVVTLYFFFPEQYPLVAIRKETEREKKRKQLLSSYYLSSVYQILNYCELLSSVYLTSKGLRTFNQGLKYYPILIKITYGIEF